MSADLPFHLLWVSGPGGVGKSTLLRSMSDLAVDLDVATVFVDATTLDPTAPAVEAAVRDALAEYSGRVVLLLDGMEALEPLDGWLRTGLLPRLPADTLVVVAGRHPPGPAWRADLGWAQHLRTLRLGDLDPSTAGEYLARRGIPEPLRDGIVARTHGHPLALALVSDVIRQHLLGPASSDDLPDLAPHDVMAELLGRFVDGVYDGVRRQALQVLGHARVTTVGLLRDVLGSRQADECFDWMCGLSFVEPRGDGVAAHDLARDLLEDDLRWRDPDGWTNVHDRVQGHGTRRLLQGGRAAQTAAADLLWLHRRSPILAPFATWADGSSLRVEPATPEDLPDLLALVSEHEGPASAALHERWWQTHPEAVHVVRSSEHRVHGVLVYPRLRGPSGPDRPHGNAVSETPWDPVALAACQLVNSLTPLRPGEHLRVIRSWLGRDGYYQPTPTNQVLTAFVARTAVGEQGLAVTVGYAVDPDLWSPLYGYADYARAPQGDAVVGDTAYAAFLHDWRVTPPPSWLDLLDARLRQSVGPSPSEAPAPVDYVAHARRHLEPATGAVLTEAALARAVREAFRSATDDRALSASPLLRSRWLAARVGLRGAPSATDLRDGLAAEVEALGRRHRREMSARVLTLTYLTPTRTQEAAAARLSLPFSTYRRHLTTGLREVAQAVWEAEIASARP